MFEFQLVLPAYNEGPSLQKIIERTVESAKSFNLSPSQFQLILVNNGSIDESATILSELKKGPLGSWFTVESIPVNQGYGHGLMMGLKRTSASIVGWSHSDEQCEPSDAFRAWDLIKKSQTKNLLVKGVRSGRNGKDIFVSRVFELFSNLILGLRVYEINAQPKVFPSTLLAKLVNPPKTFAFDLYVLYQARKLNWELVTVPVLFPPRIHGLSRWAASFMGRYKTILGMILYMVKLAKEEGRIRPSA